MDGGYDSGYAQCPCFWGRHPGSLVRTLGQRLTSLEGMRVLDLGCGEGKNAVFLAERGASVIAVDVSQQALFNARRAWTASPELSLLRASALDLPFRSDVLFDVVVAYGLLHCLSSREHIETAIEAIQRLTKRGGYHVICSFNDRSQDLAAHPNFKPTLIPHSDFAWFYRSWEILEFTDTDLHETHPHNMIRHHHSMTRLMARSRP